MACFCEFCVQEENGNSFLIGQLGMQYVRVHWRRLVCKTQPVAFISIHFEFDWSLLIECFPLRTVQSDNSAAKPCCSKVCFIWSNTRVTKAAQQVLSSFSCFTTHVEPAGWIWIVLISEPVLDQLQFLSGVFYLLHMVYADTNSDILL